MKMILIGLLVLTFSLSTSTFAEEVKLAVDSTVCSYQNGTLMSCGQVSSINNDGTFSLKEITAFDQAPTDCISYFQLKSQNKNLKTLSGFEYDIYSLQSVFPAIAAGGGTYALLSAGGTLVTTSAIVSGIVSGGAVFVVILAAPAVGLGLAGAVEGLSDLRWKKMANLLSEAKIYAEGFGQGFPGPILSKFYKRLKKNHLDSTNMPSLLDVARSLEISNRNGSACNGNVTFRDLVNSMN